MPLEPRLPAPHSPPPPEPAPRRKAFSDEALLLSDAPVPGLDTSGHARPRDEASELWIETIADWSQLAALDAEWTELAEAAAEPNAFYEPWMLLPALRAFAGADVEVALVFGPHPSRAKGRRQLCGLFPVQFRRGRAELWRHRYCYLTTPLLRSGSARAALTKFLDWIAGRAPVVRLEDVPGDGEFRLLLVDELLRRRWPSVVSEAYTRAVLRRAPTAEAFLERALPGKRRKELRRQRTRLGELGQLETAELQPGDDPRPWISGFLELEASGWKGRDGVAASSRGCDQAFIDEMALAAAGRGRLQMLALRLDGRPIALKMNLFGGAGAFAFKIAFDESFARFSPGVQLELDNVRRAHELTGLRWMDSCAAPNRFMINHLWPDRREMQTLFFAAGSARGGLAVSLVPLVHFVRARLSRLGSRSP
jgi:CelD/BcsL family acetyltransferase involved in cellulose biosynthesis